VEVEPSIYAADFSRLGEQLDGLADEGARLFHFDMGDGQFIPEVTIGPVVLRSISGRVHERGGALDCHLMVVEPQRHFESVREAGGDSVTFHIEAVEDPLETAGRARALGLAVGMAFKPETEVERVAEAIAGVDVVLCMSIHPGYSGQRFMPEAISRIERLRALVPDTLLIQVDGGISVDNAADVRSAGADLLVAGSAVFWRDDPVVAYRELQRAAEAGR
jgi:ribulose-phosphate 3-epimerase